MVRSIDKHKRIFNIVSIFFPDKKRYKKIEKKLEEKLKKENE